ncbi:MAG: GFA family protein [Pseudomonadota bacterium]
MKEARRNRRNRLAANLFASNATITWLSGQASVKTFVVPDTRHRRCFCTRCGDAVPSVQMDGALLVVPAGSLDSPLGIRLDAHICVASSAEWNHQLEEVPGIDALPT